MRAVSESLPHVYGVLDYVYDGIDQRLRSRPERARASFLQGCLPLLMNEMPADVLITHVGKEKYEALRECYRKMTRLNLWYCMEMGQVLTAMRDADIPVMVLKGADIAATLYPRPDLRYFDDVDLMVQPKDLAAAVTILERLGYIYHQEYRFEAIAKNRAGFVYVKSVVAGHLMFELHTSPHANELGVVFHVDELWKHARQITVADVPMCGMGLEDLLLYLCWHYRSHTFDRLIWLYDVAVLLMSSGDQLDWGKLYRTARKQGLLATVHFVVSWCQQLWAIRLPEESHIERYAPPSFVQWLIHRVINNDTKFLLSKSKAAARQRKLLQHLMVDDVRGLLLVELRTIFPTPTHLGRLYMENSLLPLQLYWIYYFVHPVITLREALKVLFHK